MNSHDNPHNPTLSTKQLKAISVILAARNISEGVKTLGISRDTFYDWMKESAFKEEFGRQQKALIDLALNELKVSISDAVGVLRKLLKAKSAGIRYKTATAIIENVLKSIEMENLEMRIEALERSLKK